MSKYFGSKYELADFLLILASQNLVFVAALLILSSLSFFLNISISSSTVLISLVVSVLWCYWISERYFGANYQRSSILFVLLVFIFCILLSSCVAISGLFFDLSWDGQAYHQETIIQLMNGWNPVYNDIPDNVLHSIWTNHYSKGAEVNAAALSTVTDSIEKCKALNLFLIVTTFIISFSTIVLTFDHIKLKYAFVVGLLISMNPVSIYQSLSFYVDGQLASLISCLSCLIFLLSKKIDELVLLCLISTIILAINIKFLGLIYVFIISLGSMVWTFINQKENSLIILKYLLLSFFIGIFIVGFNPYITNSIDHGTPLYPVFGSDFDLLMLNTPSDFQNANPFGNLFRSIFSRSTAGVSNSAYRIPFLFTIDDLQAFQTPDVRLSGFGPLFSGAIVLCIFNLLQFFRSNDHFMLKNHFRSVRPFIILFLMISVLINPSSWWARFVPQLWLIPLFLSLSFFAAERKFRLFYYLNHLLILVLVVNVLLISFVYLHSQIESTEAMHEQLGHLSSINKEDIQIKFQETYSNRIRFNENNIVYHEVKELNASNSFKLPYSDTIIHIVNSTSA